MVGDSLGGEIRMLDISASGRIEDVQSHLVIRLALLSGSVFRGSQNLNAC